MSPFELVEPRTLAEAIAALDASDGAVRPMSGGTALMLMMKAGVLRPSRLVNLRRLGLDQIKLGTQGELQVGAMVTLRALEKSPLLKGWPVIVRTLRTLSNVRVRNVATVGGHLAHGDPHMDLPPLLSALAASVTIAGPKGERTASVEAIYAGYLETTLARDELITALSVPAMGSRRAVYLKCTTRSADDWPALGMAVVLDGQRASIVLSAATDKPTRLAAAEKILSGSSLDDKLIQRAADAAREVRIEGDLHGSAAYKKHLIGVYLRRAIHEARNASR
ncbi:MAG TPA: xanthine dehydrogenase family protein subunit M [Burkholderiales bacterium]